MYNNQEELLKQNKPHFASFRVVPEAGHWVSICLYARRHLLFGCNPQTPQDNPMDTAIALFGALVDERNRYMALDRSRAILPRL